MYKQYIPHREGMIKGVFHLEHNLFIPFDLDNSDYNRFKKAINEGTAKLQDVERNIMNTEQAKEFIKDLP